MPPAPPPTRSVDVTVGPRQLLPPRLPREPATVAGEPGRAEPDLDAPSLQRWLDLSA